MSDTGTSEAIVADPGETATADAGSLFAGKLLFWLPVVPLVVLDLWSKSAAFGFLRDLHGRFESRASYTVFTTSWIDFDLVNYLNHGTIWGLFHDWHQPLKYVRLAAIAMIQEAIDRMDDDARVPFGACLQCSEEVEEKRRKKTDMWIPKARLEYIPWARFCIQHQEEIEKNRESA